MMCACGTHSNMRDRENTFITILSNGDFAIESGLYPLSSAYSGFELDPVPQGLKPVTFIEMIGTAEAMP